MVFERFIVNDSNHLAAEAARAVAEHPATIYNPFLVYGGVGIGKTHLLHAIANSCQSRGLRVLYVSSEAFTNDLVHAIRNRTSPMFREKYRSVDVLLVDDIQFIRGKDTTQEEFFHTFNTLVNYNRQIVLASDRHPRELTTLEDRLRSRFQGGLVADIGPPELETRIAIMELWARERNVQVPMNVLTMIAERSSSCIRELNGLFNQIAARLRMNGGANLSVGRAEATLNRYEKPAEQITIGHVIDVIAAAFHLDSDTLKGKKRVARINHARQVAMFLARVNHARQAAMSSGAAIPRFCMAATRSRRRSNWIRCWPRACSSCGNRSRGCDACESCLRCYLVGPASLRPAAQPNLQHSDILWRGVLFPDNLTFEDIRPIAGSAFVVTRAHLHFVAFARCQTRYRV